VLRPNPEPVARTTTENQGANPSVGSSQTRLLEVLAGLGPLGATTKEWADAAVADGISRSTFTRRKRELIDARQVHKEGIRWLVGAEPTASPTAFPVPRHKEDE
jgi:hypothetical protein